MIITPNAITYFLTGQSKIDHKLIIKLAKMKGLEHDKVEANRKNLKNALDGRHRPSQTTITNIKSFLVELVDDKEFKHQINNADIFEKNDISTLELKYEYLESLYEGFFRAAGLEQSFLAHEVKNTLKALKEIYLISNRDSSDKAIDKELSQNKLLPKIDYDNCLYLEISDKVSSFNLDLLLYFFACLDLEEKGEGDSLFQPIFDCLSTVLKNKTMKEVKLPFAYYIEIVKKQYKKIGKELKSSQIAEQLDIEEAYFHHFTTDRKLTQKLIIFLFNQGHVLFFIVSFWTGIIKTFSLDVDLRNLVFDKVSSYEKYLEIAEHESKKFNNKNRA